MLLCFDSPNSHDCGRLYFQRPLEHYLSSHMLFLQSSKGEVGSVLPPLESGQGGFGLTAEEMPHGPPGQLVECGAASAVLTGILLLERWAAVGTTRLLRGCHSVGKPTQAHGQEQSPAMTQRAREAQPTSSCPAPCCSSRHLTVTMPETLS